MFDQCLRYSLYTVRVCVCGLVRKQEQLRKHGRPRAAPTPRSLPRPARESSRSSCFFTTGSATVMDRTWATRVPPPTLVRRSYSVSATRQEDENGR